MQSFYSMRKWAVLAIIAGVFAIAELGVLGWAVAHSDPQHAPPGNVECDNGWSLENDPLCQPVRSGFDKAQGPIVALTFAVIIFGALSISSRFDPKSRYPSTKATKQT